MLFDGCPDVVRFDIAENSEDAIVGTSESNMELFQIVHSNVGNACFRSECIETVTGIAEKAPSHPPGAALEELILLGANAGELDLSLAFERSFGESGIEDDIGHEADAGREIAAHHLGIYAEAVVAAITVDAATDGLNLAGNFLGRTMFGPFEEQLSRELRDTVFVRRFGEDATFENGAKLNEWEAVILFYKQAEAILKLKPLDRRLGSGFDVRYPGGSAAGGKQRIQGAIFGREILASD